ncbi:MAG: PLP-dependent aminotransferase family protein [bacterium]
MTTSGARRGSRLTTSPDILAHLVLERGTSTPLHQQIYEGLRRAILSGALRPEQRVPSTRILAIELGVSRLPVLAAYDQLLHEGYLNGRRGSGTFVSAALPDDLLRSVRGAPRATRTSKARKKAPPARDDGGHRPFRASVPALDHFPHALWSRIVARHARTMSGAHMSYGDPAGLGTLRVAIAEHLRTARAVQCEAEQVLIVSGSQAAVRLCASVLLTHGDRVAIEEPGYPGARIAMQSNGTALVPVPVDDEGINVDALKRLSARVRAVYVTPSHQFPLGVSMTVARRLALLDWAERHDAWVIEDDYDSEFRYVSHPLGALQGMNAQGRVVYVGTFSKALFPALRVGYLVVPPSLWTAFMEAREAFDVFPSTLYQLALETFLREGHYTRHLRRMRQVYAARREALVAGVREHCGDLLTIHNGDAGLHVATVLREGIDDVAVVRRMAERGMTATALSTCYIGAVKRSGLLLGFGGWDTVQIAGATKELGEVLREFAGGV